jgi:hypothetical protein
MHARVEAMEIFRSSAVAQDMINAAGIPIPHSTLEANPAKIRPVTYLCLLGKVQPNGFSGPGTYGNIRVLSSASHRFNAHPRESSQSVSS